MKRNALRRPSLVMIFLAMALLLLGDGRSETQAASRTGGKRARLFRRAPVRNACQVAAKEASGAEAQVGPRNPVRPRDQMPWKKLFDGRSLAGWQVADEADFANSGKVIVHQAKAAGPKAGNGKAGKGRIELGMGNPATGIVRTTKMPTINYEIKLDAMRTGGGDFFCGLTFPVRDEFCTLIIGGWGGGVVGLSNLDSLPASENHVSNFKDFKDNQWYAIRLLVTEKKIQAWIDGESMLEVETDKHRYDIWWEQEPMRPLGIATWYTSAALRDLQIKNVKPGQANK